MYVLLELKRRLANANAEKVSLVTLFSVRGEKMLGASCLY